MPRRTVAVPSYRRHKPTGQAVVRLDGRDIYLGKHGTPSSQERYRRLIAEWLSGHPLAALSGGRPVEPGALAPTPLTINQLVIAYLDFANGYYVREGEATRECVNIKYALKPLVSLYGSSFVGDLGPLALKTVRDAMVREDLCRKLVNQRVNTIRRMFKWGVENEVVPASTLHGLQAVAPIRRGRSGVRESKPIKPVPDAMVDAVIRVCPPGLAGMIEIQRRTGMRPGEIVVMRTRDLDTTGKPWTYRLTEHKTAIHGKERTVYLGPACQRVLKPLLKRDLDAYIFSPRENLTSMNFVKRLNRVTPMTPSQRARRPKASPRRTAGDRYTTQSYERAICYACDRAFPHPVLSRVRKSELTPEQRQELGDWQKAHRWAPNRLRHNAATFLRKEFGIEAARVVLGHSSPRITEIYAEQDLTRAAEIMSLVG
ncbi:MAG: site-specific integrase [Planctomycetota bacterium]|nr:site-specific integrase [Planctomycetota bacterium]